MCKKILIMILMVFIFAGQLYSGTTGKISGRVTDGTTGEALVGVNIVIVGTGMGAASDLEGNYFIMNIPPGVYTLRATGIGLAPVTVENVRISVDQTTKVDFVMREEAIQVQDVVVSAERPIVQQDLTSTEAKVSGDQISMLPLEDVQSVINLQAGVVDGHVRGGRTSEVKYLIDGVSVNDAFSGTSSLMAEVNSIQEVQVITGTFNAEYGEALSGVVNQVTRIAGERYSGDFSFYAGDYYTDRDQLYPNIGHVTPEDVYNFQGSISGPVPGTSGILKFLAAGKYLYDDGYLYGRRMFNPYDSSNFSDNDKNNWYIGATGDNKYVPMNYNRRYSLQGKLNIGIGNAKGLVLQAIYQDRKYKDYNHLFKLNPEGDYTRFQNSLLGSAGYNHVLGKNTFVDILASYLDTESKQYVSEDPFAFDIVTNNNGSQTVRYKYVDPRRRRDVSGNSFLTGGTENWDVLHRTITRSAKLDITSQINKSNEVKGGVEVNVHRLSYRDFQIQISPATGIPYVSEPGSFDYNIYTNKPYQMSAYLQDKIELEYLVVNAGVRFDYFEPDGQVLTNPDSISVLDPLKPPYPSSYFYKAKSKQQISPRLGISYPMSERGALHVSYGHFFQIPPFDFLYRNPNFRVALSGDYPDFIGNVIGNADLQPQRTTIYEIGLQQQLGEEIGINLTAYYKDIRNLLGTEIHIKNNVRKFAKFVNRDYGAVSGFIIALDKRFSSGFSFSMDYTYQIAKGNASDPNDAFNKAQASPPIDINKQLVYLDWDRRHSLNFVITAGIPDNFIGSIIGRLGSGLPYTPALQNQRTGLENSDNRPSIFNIDLYMTKYLKIAGLNLSVFVKVYNLFDTENELNIFSDTGRAGYTLDLTRAQAEPRGVNTLEEYFTRPDFYSAPRQIVAGASFSF